MYEWTVFVFMVLCNRKLMLLNETAEICGVVFVNGFEKISIIFRVSPANGADLRFEPMEFCM